MREASFWGRAPSAYSAARKLRGDCEGTTTRGLRRSTAKDEKAGSCRGSCPATTHEAPRSLLAHLVRPVCQVRLPCTAGACLSCVLVCVLVCPTFPAGLSLAPFLLPVLVTVSACICPQRAVTGCSSHCLPPRSMPAAALWDQQRAWPCSCSRCRARGQEIYTRPRRLPLVLHSPRLSLPKKLELAVRPWDCLRTEYLEHPVN